MGDLPESARPTVGRFTKSQACSRRERLRPASTYERSYQGSGHREVDSSSSGDLARLREAMVSRPASAARSKSRKRLPS